MMRMASYLPSSSFRIFRNIKYAVRLRAVIATAMISWKSILASCNPTPYDVCNGNSSQSSCNLKIKRCRLAVNHTHKKYQQFSI